MRLNKGQNNYQDRVLSFAIHRLGYKSGPLPLDFIYKYLDKDINKEELHFPILTPEQLIDKIEYIISMQQRQRIKEILQLEDWRSGGVR